MPKLISRNNATYYKQLTPNFTVKEYFVSDKYPALAYDGFLNCKDQVFNNIIILAIIEQNIRDFVNSGSSFGIRVYNNSGHRNPTLNKNVNGEDESFHLLGMSVDFHCGEENNHYLSHIYDYLQDGIPEYLKPYQVGLYQNKEGIPLFIHITIPQPGRPQMVWIKEI